MMEPINPKQEIEFTRVEIKMIFIMIMHIVHLVL